MRVIIYIRVSTTTQEKKFSLEGQRTELTKYAESMDWNIVATYQDNESGNKLDKDGLNALLDDVEDGKADVVLVFDQDRLSRLDTLEWEFLKDVLRRNKVKISEPGRITDLTNDDDVFFSDLKNLIAQRERKSVVRRMMNGKKQRMREGKGYGKPPFGYIFDKSTGEYLIDEEWAWTVEFIDNLYLNEQIGLQTIADRMNEISPTPTGRPWNETLVMRRLISKAFHGVMEKTFKDGETITIEKIYPQLRTKEIYDKIQEMRKKRRTQWRATRESNIDLHLFRRTIFKCSNCGRKLNLEESPGIHVSNFYIRHGRKVRMSTQEVCYIGINTRRFEANVMKAIEEILSSESLASKYIEIETKEKDKIDIEEKLRHIETAYKKAKLKSERLLEIYLDGDLERDTYLAKKEEFDKLTETLSQQREEIKAKNELLLSSEWGYNLIEELFEIAKNFETELTPFEQANMFGTLFPEAVVYGEERIVFITYMSGVPVEVSIPVDKNITRRMPLRRP